MAISTPSAVLPHPNLLDVSCCLEVIASAILAAHWFHIFIGVEVAIVVVSTFARHYPTVSWVVMVMHYHLNATEIRLTGLRYSFRQPDVEVSVWRCCDGCRVAQVNPGVPIGYCLGYSRCLGPGLLVRLLLLLEEFNCSVAQAHWKISEAYRLMSDIVSPHVQ